MNYKELRLTTYNTIVEFVKEHYGEDVDDACYDLYLLAYDIANTLFNAMNKEENNV